MKGSSKADKQRSENSPRINPLQNTLSAISERIVKLIQKGKVKIRDEPINFSRNSSLSEIQVKNNSRERLYQKMHKKWADKQKLEKEIEAQVMKNIRKQRYTDFEEIKRHEEKLDEVLRREDEERKKKIEQQKEEKEKRLHMYKPSKFFVMLKQREQADRELSYEKSMQSRLLAEKRLQYSKAVKSVLLPQITKRSGKQNNQYTQTEAPSPKKITALQRNQVFRLGVHYLDQARSLARRQPKLEPINVNSPRMKKYRDYMLHDPNIKVLTPREKIIQLSGSKGLKKYEQLQNVRLLSQQMDGDIGNSQSKLIESLLTKLQVINKLMA